jgi:hypothetical protein
MSYKEENPVVTIDSRNEEVYSHPAYGVVVLTHVSGGNGVLFGSDIGHMGRMRISVSRSKLHRHLSNDWIHGEGGLPLIEFEMSHAQFAEFITGVGRGEGTPCTLRYAASGPIEEMPAIKSLETKQDLFKREIRGSVAENLQAVSKQITKLQEMIDSGKLSKPELREIAKDLRNYIDRTPADLEFVIEQSEEALDKATTHAKIEVEAFIGAKARSLGLESIQQLAQIALEKG